MKKALLPISILALLLFTGCAVTLPVAATSNPVGSKVGKSTATGFFGTFFFDQSAGIREAAKNGKITKISTVDLKYKNILWIVVSYETTVTGE